MKKVHISWTCAVGTHVVQGSTINLLNPHTNPGGEEPCKGPYAKEEMKEREENALSQDHRDQYFSGFLVYKKCILHHHHKHTHTHVTEVKIDTAYLTFLGAVHADMLYSILFCFISSYIPVVTYYIGSTPR